MKKWTKTPPNFRDIWISNNFCLFQEQAVNSDHMWVESNASGDYCYAMEPDCLVSIHVLEYRSLFHVYISADCYKSLFEISGAKKILIVAAFFPLVLSACQPSAQPSVFLLLICIIENCLDFFLCLWSVIRPDYFCLEKENLRVKNLYYMRFAENRFHISLDRAKYANAEKTCLTINSCAYRDHVCKNARKNTKWKFIMINFGEKKWILNFDEFFIWLNCCSNVLLSGVRRGSISYAWFCSLTSWFILAENFKQNEFLVRYTL